VAFLTFRSLASRRVGPCRPFGQLAARNSMYEAKYSRNGWRSLLRGWHEPMKPRGTTELGSVLVLESTKQDKNAAFAIDANTHAVVQSIGSA